MNIEQVCQMGKLGTFKKTRHRWIPVQAVVATGEQWKPLGRPPVNRSAHLNGSFFAFNLLLDKSEHTTKISGFSSFYTRTQRTNKDYFEPFPCCSGNVCMLQCLKTALFSQVYLIFH